MRWATSGLAFGPARSGPIIRVEPPKLRIDAILIGSLDHPDGLPLYVNANDFHLAGSNFTALRHFPGGKSLDGWAKGTHEVKRESPSPERDKRPPNLLPTWQRGRKTQNPTCLVRNAKLRLIVTLTASVNAPYIGRLRVRATLGGSSWTQGTQSFLQAEKGRFSVTLDLDDPLPNVVAATKLQLKWAADELPLSVFRLEDLKTDHLLFITYAYPLLAGFDTSSELAVPVAAQSELDHTATPKRLRRMMSLLKNQAKADDLEEIYWLTHKGINDTPGAPFFNPIHNQTITHDGTKSRIMGPTSWIGTGVQVPHEDQWLMWIESAAPHWNGGSCMCHVQLAKTMLASIGIFARRMYITPATTILPKGAKYKAKPSDLYQYGDFEPSKRQAHVFEHKGESLKAYVCLMEPKQSYENFEACLRTPKGRLLPGGYTTTGVAKDAPGFLTQKGFGSPLEVLQWWTNTKRGSFSRFLCWLWYDGDGKPVHCWDRDGKYYDIKDYEEIRDKGKQLELPDEV